MHNKGKSISTSNATKSLDNFNTVKVGKHAVGTTRNSIIEVKDMIKEIPGSTGAKRNRRNQVNTVSNPIGYNSKVASNIKKGNEMAD